MYSEVYFRQSRYTLLPCQVQYKANGNIFKSSLFTVLRGYLLRLIGTDKGSILLSSVSN